MGALRKVSQHEFSVILESHERWLRGESGGERATFSGVGQRSENLSRSVPIAADLRSSDVRRADLRSADLGDAVLREADLSGADLSRAVLWGADLSGAVLSGANLRGANLREADLGDADLRNAILRGADLSRADLRSADLRGTDLGDADLRDADLSRADLRGADLRGANLGDAVLRGTIPHDAVLSEADIRGNQWGAQTNLAGAGLRGAILPPDFYVAAGKSPSVPEPVSTGPLFSGAAKRLDTLLHPLSTKRPKTLTHLRFFWAFAKNESIYEARKTIGLEDNRNSQITYHLKALARLLDLDRKEFGGLYVSPKDSGEDTARLTEAGNALKKWIEARDEIRKAIERA